MAKTHKVMDLQMDGNTYICVKDSTAKHNPYKLYRKWWDGGWHKKKIVEYCDMDSILFHLLQMKYPKASWDLTA